MPTTNLTLFDLDGTLISSYMDDEPKDFHSWVPLPGRLTKLDELRRERTKLGVVTNQAGIAFGYNSEADWRLKRGRVSQVFGFRESDFFVCFAHPKADPPYNSPGEVLRRKPNAAMLEEAMEHFRVGPEHTLFVGDMESDAEAARHAHVTYMDAEEFFT